MSMLPRAWSTLETVTIRAPGVAQQPGQQQAREREVPQVVDAELRLEAVRRRAGTAAPSRPRC